MFSIDRNGKITITKGDTGNTILFISQGPINKPTRYTLTGNDKVDLWVHKYNIEPTSTASTYLLYKQFTTSNLDENGDVEIRFNIADTSSIPKGSYVYTMKVYTNNLTDVSTLYNAVSFIIE